MRETGSIDDVHGAQDATGGPRPDTPQTTVLVVDDEEDTRESVATVIRVAFPTVQVKEAADAFQALEYLQRHPVDIILSDHKMPKMSGVKFLSEASRLSDAPRVLMTAYGSLDVAVDAINHAHVSSFFLKPLQVEVLVEAVSHHLGLEPVTLSPQSAPNKVE